MSEDIMKSHESTRQVTSDYTGLLRISPLWKVSQSLLKEFSANCYLTSASECFKISYELWVQKIDIYKLHFY